MANIVARNLKLELPIGHLPPGAIQHAEADGRVGGHIFLRGRRGWYVRAVDGINLELSDGDRLAIIGHNGAGKSCLLRLLARVYVPTGGRLNIDGKVAAVLTTSVGLQADATGYENIMLAGLLRGLTRQDVARLTPEIADFSELGDYLNLPIRAYSSGMKMRLGFAIATAVEDIEILLIDEVVGAGDSRFQQRAKARVTSIMQQARILALASHSADMLRTFCNKALWLDHGRIRALGPIDEVLESYEFERRREKRVAK